MGQIVVGGPESEGPGPPALRSVCELLRVNTSTIRNYWSPLDGAWTRELARGQTDSRGPRKRCAATARQFRPRSVAPQAKTEPLLAGAGGSNWSGEPADAPGPSRLCWPACVCLAAGGKGPLGEKAERGLGGGLGEREGACRLRGSDELDLFFLVQGLRAFEPTSDQADSGHDKALEGATRDLGW